MKFRRPNQHFQIVAHRGLPEDYPENTIIAYRHALMLHIDMLEIDVHYTKDKELVVIHDDTIDRTSNGKGKVSDFTLKELKALDFGFYKGEKFKGERSFDFDCVKKLSAMNLDYELGLLISKKKYWHKLPNFKKIAKVADYANPNYQIVSKKFMQLAHEEELKVLPYTVNKLKESQKLIDIGVDGIISDVPEDLFEL
ncbi:MAG: glycerophosphodiester phosphodiesterase family protein [Staphylococcus epidermidis]|nr:glycerophosphodiester phosphodiesterase family protein [Staphylococcus epidermidis]